jgi:hypothetical protein
MIGNAITGGCPSVGGGGTPFTNLYSAEFDGVDDYIATNAIYTSLNGLAKASFSIWVKPTSVGSLKLKQTFHIGRGSTGNDSQCNLWIFESNRIEFTVNTSGSYFRGNIASITYGSWNHILCTVDMSLSSNQGTIYVNGVDVTTSQSMGGVTAFPNATDELYVGESKTGQYNPFLGNIDEFAIFPNTVLSASDATALYNGGTPTDLSTFSTPPSNWWRMGDNNGGTGTALSDAIGSASATLLNGTTYTTDVP